MIPCLLPFMRSSSLNGRDGRNLLQKAQPAISTMKYLPNISAKAISRQKKAQSILHYQVIRYDCDINLDSDRIPDPDSLTKNMMPESITYFTPVIESDK